jgi:hypothetical protein
MIAAKAFLHPPAAAAAKDSTTEPTLVAKPVAASKNARWASEFGVKPLEAHSDDEEEEEDAGEASSEEGSVEWQSGPRTRRAAR